MEPPAREASGNVPYLEQLFLISQFYARDTDEAARLVDRVYQDVYTEDAVRTESLSSLVARLVKHFRQLHPVIMDTAAERTDAQSVRAREADRFLSERCRLQFLALDPDDKLALWHAVETGSEPGMLLESDALGAFVQNLDAVLSSDERQVFGQFVNRTTVANALRRYWNTGFVPVPPTLRAIVESADLRRQGPETRTRRPAPAPRKKKPRARMLQRITVYAWVIVAATGLGYLLTRIGEPAPPSNDILELSLFASDNVQLTFRTDNAEQAERFIEDRFGWRLSLPEITETSLEGISLVHILDSIELPVLVFSDNTDNSTIPVFTFSYAFLETNSERFGLSRDTLRQIQETAQFDIHEYKKRRAVVWRDRDDIFAAFIPDKNEDFQSRVIVRS